MSLLLGDAWRALIGVWSILIGRPDALSRFDVSATGLARSFLGAAVVAAPIYALIVAGEHYVLTYLGSPNAGTPPWLAALTYGVLWLYFPLVAALVTRVLGRRDAFAAWVVVHNWAVVLILSAQAVPLLLFIAGLRDEALLSAWFLVLQIAAVMAHWRVANAALGMSWQVVTAATCIHVFAWRLLQASLYQLTG